MLSNLMLDLDEQENKLRLDQMLERSSRLITQNLPHGTPHPGCSMKGVISTTLGKAVRETNL